jgi:hypothetical protein
MQSTGNLKMQVKCIRQWEDLQPLKERWSELAGDCPFRGWSWLSTWWKHYGCLRDDTPGDGAASLHHELYVLLVFDDTPHQEEKSLGASSRHVDLVKEKTPAQALVAIAPCYIEQTFARGRVLRLLGDGEICSDHLSFLVDSQLPNQTQILEALVNYLSQHVDDWDLLEFASVEDTDSVLAQVFDLMNKQGYQVRRSSGLQRWSVPLPESWESYLAQLSKSHRKQIRRLKRRVIETDRFVRHLVRSSDQLEVAWDRLVDLHQRRRNSLGEPGCFASARFANFHRNVVEQLWREEKLQLSWIELDGEPVAAEYVLAGNSASYAYQSGLSPERIAENPGQMSLICAIGQAIDSGHQQFDLLRGDEPYKAHWRAQPHATLDVQIVPPRTRARWRYHSWSHFRQAGQWVRGVLSVES